MAGGILLAHDLTDRCAPVALAAANLATRLGLEFNVIYAMSTEALEKDRASRPADSAYIDNVLDDLRAQLRWTVESEIDGSGGLGFTVEVVQGKPHTAVLEYVKRHRPEFTFVGIRNRSRVGKLLFGSVPQAILLGSEGKVVAVPIKD